MDGACPSRGRARTEMTLPGLPLALPKEQLEALRAAYAEPPRAYHDFSHVTEVMRHYHLVAAGPGWRQPREVALAVLYHDAIYLPCKSDPDARSAALISDNRRVEKEG